ncbi:MAG: hypothetical protein V4640_13285 [Verrucomicrobiota bacterium]
MTAFLISCENATCAVPEPFRDTFRGSEEVVMSTRGWEPGSLALAQGFAMKFRTPLVHGDVTRLLIDLGQEGDARWSEFSSKLPEATRVKVMDRHERPFRSNLEQRIDEDLRRNDQVLHVTIHTDPLTDGLVMLETPVGAVAAEKFAAAWRNRIAAEGVDVRHVCGSGSTPLGEMLSGKFPADRYARVRLSVSQSFFLEGRPLRWESLKKLLVTTLADSASEVAPISGPAFPAPDPR